LTHHKHFDQLKEIAMAGLTLTVCGSILLMSQQEAHASTDEISQETTVNANINQQSTNNMQVPQTAPINSQSGSQAAQASTQARNAAYLYSDNLAQVNNAQNINFPSGYTLDNVRNVNGTAGAQRFENNVAIQGIYENNYQSDPNAAAERVDIDNLTSDQVAQLNSYGLNLINRARAEFGQAPFTQDNTTINATRNLALQYQDKNESLLLGDWHDNSIITYHSENIAAFQVYDDNIPGLVAAPFATARGADFASTNSVPLFSINNMDDMQAMIYYGVMGMLFNDASDNFDHAKNFLVFRQPISSMALYPSLTTTISHNGRWSNGRTFSFKLKNVDMHYIWVTGNDNDRNHFSNIGTVHSWNTGDNGNYAYLDHSDINNAGVLSVSGWHATNASEGRPYHFLIVLDQNNHEIKRVRITDPVNRPDVQRVHNVYGAEHSGFNQQIDLKSALAYTSTLKLISRYTDDPVGNGNYVDYYFAPITVNQSNNAYLDRVAAVGSNLVISGWHATNQASNKPYHFIIIIDPSNGNREIGRRLVSDGINRPDVARAYPDIVNADKAGFSVSLPLSAMNFNHELQIISRYSSDPTGNSNYVDYWFPPFTSGHSANRGYLDNFQISGNKLLVAGWHANNTTRFEQHHYLILWDSTAGRQVASKEVQNVSRPDVARVYPDIANDANSGFNTSFDLTMTPIIPGHAYTIVSRYSSDDTGNGNGNGQQYTDYWFDPRVIKHD
jgi:SEC10/PgrA surface exclusion-like protein